MINTTQLLNDLKSLMRRLEPDIRERCDAASDVNSRLENEHFQAREKGRTAQSFSVWRDEIITQASAAWILACVFVRFMEDNGLVETSFISGVGGRINEARDYRTLYFKAEPRDSDREYLMHVFRTVSDLPGVAPLFDKTYNRLWQVGPTGDGASDLIDFFQKIDAKTGVLIHDFTDPDWDTRFLGDLYQDLSKDIRAKYALLQTPDFIESFILDRTLTPAVETFGLDNVRLMDPSCGSGHFLIGAFHRLLNLWQQQTPEINERELVQRSLNAVYGVDINPQATAIARFRLLVAALKASDIRELKNAPAFDIHLATGDSLLHGPRPGNIGARQQYLLGDDPVGYVYETEDEETLRKYLGRQYHAVVGNPPYITVKDKAVNQAYRDRFKASCYRQYSLVCPFLERFFDLTQSGDPKGTPGYMGVIVANSFMKREFGKKLIETCIPRWDLTHVIDTSGVYIPGHGTPTVILFGRNRRPVSDRIRTVMGIKGEPGTPEVAAEGKVWQAITEQIDLPGSESEFVSAGDKERKRFFRHPWSLGGGGASQVKNLIEEQSVERLKNRITTVSSICLTRLDDVYLLSDEVLRRNYIDVKYMISSYIGEQVRDWHFTQNTITLFPYNSDLQPINADLGIYVHRFLWFYKEHLWRRKELGGDHRKQKRTWWEWNRFLRHLFKNPNSITFAFVSTHNHFVLNKKKEIYHRSAPVIKLPKKATIEEHLELLGLLNSSTALFWARQVFFPKGGYASGKWEERLEWDGTKLKQFPIPEQKPLDPAQKLDDLGTRITAYLPSAFIKKQTPSPAVINEMADRFVQTRRRMIALQEELDWQCYHCYKITEKKLRMPDSEDVPPIDLGERAFEIVMARKMAGAELETAWFDRHGSTPVTEIPSHWPQAYQELVRQRIECIEADKYIRMIEQPEYKRRWAMESWDKQVKTALEHWLLNRLEFMLSGRDLMAETDPQPATKKPGLLSCAQLTDQVRADADFLQVAQLYTGRTGFNVKKLVETLVMKEAVPFLPSLRYKPSGLRKRREWEHTWDLQRKEDAIDARCDLPEEHPEYLNPDDAEKLKKETIGDIPVPPKYTTKDFAAQTFWKLRGKLDVPRERFISYPGLEHEAGQSPIITWAGWDHLQQSQALADFLEKTKAAGRDESQLIPMICGLAELLPWLRQWHNEIDPAYGIGMGDFFAEYIDGEARALGKTVEELAGWPVCPLIDQPTKFEPHRACVSS